MYCPNCGSSNQAEIKFCTRCGVNLDVVSDALRGRTPDANETDERIVKLLKDYYRGRRMTIIAGAATLIALFKLAVLLLMGFPDKLIGLTALLTGLLLFGLFALIWGMIKWNDSSSEIKALGYSPKRAKALPPVPAQLRFEAERGPFAVARSTDSMAIPHSVTEHTTHLFDDSSQTPSGNRSKESH